MREILHIKPLLPVGGKPLVVPWAIATSTAILIVIMLSAEFVVLRSENDGTGEQLQAPAQQWIEMSQPGGTPVMTLFPTPDGELYIVDGGGGNIYKLSTHGESWQHVNNISPRVDNWKYKALDRAPMVEWHNTLWKMMSVEEPHKVSMERYNTLHMVLSNELHFSFNGFETTGFHGNIPAGNAQGFLVRNDVFYLAYENGIVRSNDKGKTWVPMNDGLTGKINTLGAIENILFAGTDTGLHRFNGAYWQLMRFPVPQAVRIHAVASNGNTLYVAAGVYFQKPDGESTQQIFKGRKQFGWIFRSTNNGRSWTEITPTNAWPIRGQLPPIVLVATEEILLILGMNDGDVVRSTNGGDTWISEKNTRVSPTMFGISNAVALDNTTFYTCGNSGIHRSLDGGQSWERFNLQIDDLICIRMDKQYNAPERLYAIAGIELFKSDNGGQSWNTIRPEEQKIGALTREKPPFIFNILESGGSLYAKGKTSDERMTGLYQIGLYQVDADGTTFRPIHGMPTFNSYELSDRRQLIGDDERLRKSSLEFLQADTFGANQFFTQLLKQRSTEAEELIRAGLRGAFAISENTFYMEYNFKLFRWRHGEAQWYDTGVQETTEISEQCAMKGFKIAVLDDTIYVGKRDGHLMHSLDAGNNWNDVTTNLPFRVDTFNEIVFVGSTVYVATNNGVITSRDARNWYPVLDALGTCLVMEQLAVSSQTVYGTSKTRVYQLKSDNNTWEQFAPKVPAIVTSLAVSDSGLYVGTESSGILYLKIKNGK